MEFPMELTNYVVTYRAILHYVGKYKATSKIFNDELHKVMEYQDSYKNINLYFDGTYYYLEELKEEEYIYYKLDKEPIAGYTIEHIKYLEILVKEFKQLGKIDIECELCNKTFNYLTEGKGVKEVLAIIKKGRCRKCYNVKPKFEPSFKNASGFHAIHGDEWREDEVIEKKRKRRGRPRKTLSDYVEKEDVIEV